MTTVTLKREEIRQAVKHLKDGRDLLAKPGVWIQGSWAKRRQVCSLGALDKAINGRITRSAITRSARVQNSIAARFLGCAINEESAKACGPSFTIVNFNDDKDTTKPMLLAKWDKAIKLAQATLKKTKPETNKPKTKATAKAKATRRKA